MIDDKETEIGVGDAARESDVLRIQKDFEDLYTHVGSAVSNMNDDLKEQWKATHADLEKKRADLQDRFRELKEASVSASEDLRIGFDSAMREFKKSIAEAHRAFE